MLAEADKGPAVEKCRQPDYHDFFRQEHLHKRTRRKPNRIWM